MKLLWKFKVFVFNCLISGEDLRNENCIITTVGCISLRDFFCCFTSSRIIDDLLSQKLSHSLDFVYLFLIREIIFMIGDSQLSLIKFISHLGDLFLINLQVEFNNFFSRYTKFR